MKILLGLIVVLVGSCSCEHELLRVEYYSKEIVPVTEEMMVDEVIELNWTYAVKDLYLLGVEE